MLQYTAFWVSVGLYPSGLQGLHFLSFKNKERAQSQQQRHQWSNGWGNLHIWGTVLEQYPTVCCSWWAGYGGSLHSQGRGRLPVLRGIDVRHLIQFSCSVMSDSLQHHRLQHPRLPCPSPTPRACSNPLSLMPSNHLILYCPLLLLPSILPSIRVFSNESALHIRWPKYWSFSFSITPSNEHPGLISFRMEWLDLFAVQGTLKSLLQYHSSKASILCCTAFFIVQTLQILVKCIEQQSPSFLAPETSFMEDNFSTDQGRGGGKVSEWFKSITFIIHFISIIITLLYIMK